MLVHLDAQVSVPAGGGGTGQRAVEAHQRHGVTAAAELDALGHFSDDADLGVFVAAARHQRAPGCRAGVDGKGHRHTGEHHGVVEGDQSEGGHDSTLRLLLDDVNY